MFGHQEPDADLIAGNLFGQQLADRTLDTGRIGGHLALAVGGALSENARGAWRLGIKGEEFFFEGRNRR